MKNVVRSLAVVGGLVLFANVSDVQAAELERESNNTFSEATQLKLESGTALIKGELTTISDQDYYKFTLTNPGKVVIGINNSADTQYRVTLFNMGERELERYETPNSDSGVKDLFAQGLDAGTYYIKVENYKGVGKKVPYSLQIAYTQSNSYEKELNNGIPSANEISLNKKYYGFADASEDVYKMKVPSSGEVIVDVKQSPQTRYEVSLINKGGQAIETWTTDYNNSTATIIHTGLPEDIYYLSIKTVEGNVKNSPYEFTVYHKENAAFETENNNSTSTAEPITLGQRLEGVISSSDDVDYYRLQVNGEKDYDIYLTQPKNTTFQVEVTSQNFSVHEKLPTEYGNGNLAKVGTLDLDQGIYYIKIGYGQGANRKVPYALTVVEKGSSHISTFKDYKPGQYWVEPFEWGIKQNVIKGDLETNRLNPNKNITEAQMLAMVLRYALPNVAKDSATGKWYNTYYTLADQRGIKVTNKPSSPLRRGNVARVLAKVYSGKDLTEKESVQWLYDNGITTGVNPSKSKSYANFNPDGLITRAQAVTFMYRLYEKGITPKL